MREHTDNTDWKAKAEWLEKMALDLEDKLTAAEGELAKRTAAEPPIPPTSAPWSEGGYKE